jgi:hypothetical protein
MSCVSGLRRHGACLPPGEHAVELVSFSEDRSVTTLPDAVPSMPLGIVIKNGGPAPKPVRFWAYMWAADEEASADHWHQRVPTEHAA